MELLATRNRVTGTRPRYQYRIYAPFSALSPERVFQIHYHSDFGHGRGLLARMSEVIAPISWLAMPPGQDKFLQGRAIHQMAAAIATTVLSTLFPEVTVAPIPLLLEIADEMPDERVSVEIAEIMGGYQPLADDPALAGRLDPRRLQGGPKPKGSIMGWLTMPLSSMHPHATPKAYLDAQFTYDRRDNAGKGRALRIVASSCLRNQVYYAAAVPSTDGVDEPTFAVVCLVKWNPRDKEGYVFGYKDMTEHMGPSEAECPERILALLGDTNDPSALNWRRRCIDNLARGSRSLEHGMRIRLPSPVKFTDGYQGDEFIVHKQGRKIGLAKPGSSYPGYRVSGLRRLAWTVIPETKVHKTLFA